MTLSPASVLLRLTVKCAPDHVHIAPAQPFDLAPAHGGIQGQPRRPNCVLPLRTRRGPFEQLDLFLIGERSPDVLPNRQRANLIREMMPAFRSLQDSTNNVQFPVECRIRPARRLALSEIGANLLHSQPPNRDAADPRLDGFHSLLFSLDAARRQAGEFDPR